MTRRNHEVTLEEGYAIWASSYDDELNPLIATEEPRVEALLQTLPRPSRVLDVAAGTGRYALRFARQGADVTAFDRSPEMLAVARQKARDEGLSITFVEGPLEDGLPLPRSSFDLVVCALVLCHVADPASAVAECARVLRPGGHLLITDFHPQAIENGWQTTILRGDDAYLLPNAQHSRSTYLEAVTRSGCELVHVEEMLVRDQPPGTILAPDVDAFLQTHGDWPLCLIVLGRRPHRHARDSAVLQQTRDNVS